MANCKRIQCQKSKKHKFQAPLDPNQKSVTVTVTSDWSTSHHQPQSHPPAVVIVFSYNLRLIAACQMSPELEGWKTLAMLMNASWQRRSSWHQQLKDLLRGAVLLCLLYPRPLVDPESDIYKHTVVAADTRDSVYRVFCMMTFPREQFLKNTGCSMRQRQNKQAPSTIEQYNTDIHTLCSGFRRGC